MSFSYNQVHRIVIYRICKSYIIPNRPTNYFSEVFRRNTKMAGRHWLESRPPVRLSGETPFRSNTTFGFLANTGLGFII